MMELTNMERLHAVREIEQLIYRFAVLNDEGKADELAELFTQDGIFARPSKPETPIRGRAAIAEHYKSRPARITRHVMSNIMVSFAGANQATALSCVVLFSGEVGEHPAQLTSLMVGDFQDVFLLETGRWYFQHRSGTLRLRGMLPV